MRHAKSSWDDHRLTDHDRPLNDRGRRAAPLIGQKLLDHQFRPDVVLASTATRVRETLAALQSKWSFEPTVFFEKSLYLASRESLLAHVKGLHDSWNEVIVIGHNPGMGDLVSHLSGDFVDMPTAAVAIFESNTESWSDANAVWQRKHLWYPRELE
jgi:phosphohistidine phosphatase